MKIKKEVLQHTDEYIIVFENFDDAWKALKSKKYRDKGFHICSYGEYKNAISKLTAYETTIWP